MNPLAVIIVILVACVIAFVAYRIWKIKKNGIEADAVVIRVQEHTSYDSDGASTSYDYYVLYTTAERVQKEALITNQGWHSFQVGQHIRVKYLPEKPDAVVWIKK